MTVRLERINKDNWVDAIALRVADDQRSFVASNVYSIAEAGVYADEVTACAVYDDDTMVGFTLYGWDGEDYGGYAIIRLMVDQRYQGKGYGRAAMLAVLAELKQRADCDKVYISFMPDNAVARNLYASLGFVDDGRTIAGEVVYRLDVARG
jgi:diamine N-acetyltransferase